MPDQAIISAIITLLPADEVSDADAAAQLSTPTVIRRAFYVNSRTLYSIDAAVAKSVLDFIEVADPHLYAIMTQVGPNDGSAGGVDVGLDKTREFLDGLVQANKITSEQAGAIKALGEVVIYPCGRAITAEEVADARAQRDRMVKAFGFRSRLSRCSQKVADLESGQLSDLDWETIMGVE